MCRSWISETIEPMDFREAMHIIPGLAYLARRLDFHTATAWEHLMCTRFTDSTEELAGQFDLLGKTIGIVKNESCKQGLESVKVCLGNVRSVSRTLERLQNGEIPDDLELFELKGLAFAARSVSELAASLFPFYPPVNDLRQVCAILDPKDTGSSAFSISDMATERLDALLARLEKTQKETPGSEDEELLVEACQEERKTIRIALAAKLQPFAADMQAVLASLTRLDILLAKAQLAADTGMTVPELTDTRTNLEGIWHPEVRESVERRRGEYQLISIGFASGVTVITGANMGGKSVLLKTIALIQALTQFGFPVCAAKAEVLPVAGIGISVGDGESMNEGLSSFGAEILRINAILRDARTRRMLVLVDEPARTTNPEEGRAITRALAGILNDTDSLCLITTHYSGISGKFRRLRVRGLKENIPHGMASHEISRWIDYSLTEWKEGNEMPRDAIRIAGLLGVEGELIETAKNILYGKEQDRT